MGILLCILILFGLPIGFSLGLTAFVWLLTEGQRLLTIPSGIFNGIDSFVLLAIPFFILAGEIMNKTDLTEELIQFTTLLVGRFRGGLAQANIYASLIFGGITGVAVSDVSALGTVFIPAMEKQGYPKDFAAAMISSAAIMAPIIPPSVIIIVYGAVTHQSIGALFAGALIPGVLIGLGQSVLVAIMVMAKRRNFPKIEVKITPKLFAVSLKDASLALIMPVVILGGILGGIVTPTEAAAISIVYALVVGFVIYRNLKVADLYPMLAHTLRMTGMVLFIIAMASILSWVLSKLNVPSYLAGAPDIECRQ
jgi:tripartite ATP-independent transporter DctM subunit